MSPRRSGLRPAIRPLSLPWTFNLNYLSEKNKTLRTWMEQGLKMVCRRATRQVMRLVIVAIMITRTRRTPPQVKIVCWLLTIHFYKCWNNLAAGSARALAVEFTLPKEPSIQSTKSIFRLVLFWSLTIYSFDLFTRLAPKSAVSRRRITIDVVCAGPDREAKTRAFPRPRDRMVSQSSSGSGNFCRIYVHQS